KGWFSDDGLSGLAPFWPQKSGQEPFVPFWVPDQDMGLWREMPESQRPYYYYAIQYESLLANESILFVDYDSFVSNPKQLFGRLADAIGCEFGEKTEEILENVGERRSEQHSHMSDSEGDLRQRVCDVAEQCQALAWTTA
ncbi:hypothetical protein M1N45_02385, partial [Dehalococcoidia bacterium]|nr:hypothetical protein [Dehalococcoidia bacterium]